VAQGCRAAHKASEPHCLPNLCGRISLVEEKTPGMHFLIVVFLLVACCVVEFRIIGGWDCKLFNNLQSQPSKI
jgi:hypothetical protein